MKKIVVWKNDRGLTLVEILAALVILGIVFVGFMTVFPQMTNFNEKTENKLESMNKARSELVKIQKEPSTLEENMIISDVGGFLNYEYTVGDFHYKVRYEKKPTLESSTAGTNTLNYMEIMVYKEGTNKVSSETFGYIKKKVVE